MALIQVEVLSLFFICQIRTYDSFVRVGESFFAERNGNRRNNSISSPMMTYKYLHIASFYVKMMLNCDKYGTYSQNMG